MSPGSESLNLGTTGSWRGSKVVLDVPSVARVRSHSFGRFLLSLFSFSLAFPLMNSSFYLSALFFLVEMLLDFSRTFPRYPGRSLSSFVL